MRSIPSLVALVALVSLAALRAGPASALVLALPSAILQLLPSTRRTLAARRFWPHLWPGLLLVVDLAVGHPGLVRCAVGAAGQLLVAWALFVPWPRFRPGVPRPAAVALALAVLLWCFVALRPIDHGADTRLGQDTAYFTQVVDRAGRGETPRSDLVTALLYDPPPRSHYGAHVSPVIHPLGWLFQLHRDWKTLAVMRSLGLYLAVVVLAVWLRRRVPHAPVLALAALAFTVPVFWEQPMHAVYLLPVAAAPAALLWLGLLEGRRLAIALGMVGLALVREDALLFATVGGALSAFALRRHRMPATTCALLGLVWYFVCTRYVMPSQAPAAGQAVAVLFEDVGGPAGFLRHPGALLGRLFSNEAVLGTWTQIRATGGLALLHPLSLAALPAQGVNLLAGGKGFGTLDPVYHYAVLPSLALVLGALAALVSRANADGLRLPLFGDLPWRVAIAIWLAGAAQSALDGIDPPTLSAMRAPPQQAWIESVRDRLPETWSVAAPRAQLPGLTPRRELFMVHRVDDYPRADVDAWLVDEEVAALELRDGTEAAYRDLLGALREGRRNAREVDRYDRWVLYLRRDLSWPPEPRP